MSQLKLSTTEFEVFYREGSTDFVLVTFSDMNMRADGKSYFARTFVEKADVSCIGIVSRSPEWFPVGSMHGVLNYVAPLMAKFPQVICYGSSMGAYAAIKYSGRLRSDFVLAFSPQVTIDPAETLRFGDRRYVKYFSREKHLEMKITREDVSGNVLVFADPKFSPDFAHATEILNIVDGGILVPAPYCNHGTVRVLAGTAAFSDLLDRVTQSPLEKQSLKKDYLSRRRSTYGYYNELADHCLRRNKPARALKVIRRGVELFPRQQSVRERLVVALQRSGNYAEALLHLSDLLRDHPRSAKYHALLYFVRRGLGQKSEAVLAIAVAVEIEPSNPSYRRQYSAILAENGRYVEALEHARAATNLAPSNRSYLEHYDRVAKRACEHKFT